MKTKKGVFMNIRLIIKILTAIFIIISTTTGQDFLSEKHLTSWNFTDMVYNGGIITNINIEEGKVSWHAYLPKITDWDNPPRAFVLVSFEKGHLNSDAKIYLKYESDRMLSFNLELGEDAPKNAVYMAILPSGNHELVLELSKIGESLNHLGHFLDFSKIEGFVFNNPSNFGESNEINFTITKFVCIKENPTSISKNNSFHKKHGILIKRNPVVVDFAEIRVITPENALVNIIIYDNIGNVVFNKSGLKNDDNILWDLANNAGRIIANGSYLIVAHAKGINGKNYVYSGKIGIKR